MLAKHLGITSNFKLWPKICLELCLVEPGTYLKATPAILTSSEAPGLGSPGEASVTLPEQVYKRSKPTGQNV